MPAQEMDSSSRLGYPPSIGVTSVLTVPAGLSVAAPRARRWTLKRTLDILLSVVVLMVLALVLFLIALAILVDSGGPVLFRQQRIGKHGRPFVMWKFRSMTPERRRQPCGPPPGMLERRRVHKSMRDPRTTRVGRFLRRSCLDELPQFWNVLRGDMSIVGPRPELPEIVARYEPWQHARHLVAPGITGWWQVNRVGDVPMHLATQLDVYYVEHSSLGLDLEILARTVAVVVRGIGAF